MKKREITNNDLKQMFNNIIEQAPLISEEQVNSILISLPGAKPGSTVKRFLQYHLNTVLLIVTTVSIIVAVAFIWVNSSHQTEDTMIQNNPLKNMIVPAPADTIAAESAIFIDKEMSENNNNNKADKDTVIKKSSAKVGPVSVQADTPISLPDIYKHFDKKPQLFSIRANRDTTLICKEGSMIKINASSFVSEKTRNEITETVQIAVKEYYKMSDIILSNLTTTSGDKILESGGMLHISAMSNNENCILKPSRTIDIGFPYSDKKNDMALFYGEQTNNIIDWELASAIDDVIIQDELFIDIEPETETQVFFIVEDMPEFPGGEKALKKYIEQNAEYPFSALENKHEGKVYISFVIDKSGYANNISVVRSLDKILDKVAVYVVSNMPKWKPGKQRGKSVNVSYTIAVPFSAKNTELTPEDIKRSREIEEKLKDFKYDIESNRYFTNSKIFNEFEKKVKSDSLQDSDIREVNRYIFSVTQLGWINCDRFYKNNNTGINFYVPTDNSEKTIVNAILHRFKSLIPGKAQPDKITFNNFPLGEKVTIVALKTVNNKIFLSVNETEVTKNGELVLDFQQVTMDLLKKEMEKLNKFY